MGPAAPAFFLALIATIGLGRADFVPPAEGPVPFRRDHVPLDTDAMRDLSKQVLDLAGAAKPASPAAQRRLAQVLALAVAVDPANRPARALIGQWTDGPADLPGSAQEATAAIAAIQTTLKWLGEPEAGQEANALAACLADLIPADLDLPEAGKWTDWIPDLALYERKKAEPVLPAPAVPEKDPKPKPPAPAAVVRPTELATATVLMPLRKAGTAAVRLISVEMTGSTGSAGDEPVVRLAGDKEGKAGAYEGALRTALTPRLGTFPAGLHLDLDLPEGVGYDFRANGRMLSGAAAVLLDAALTGKAPGKTVVFAAVAPNGGLELPADFWETLRAIPADPGVRVVVPRSAAEYLSSLLTLDGPAFFFAHEVLMAGSVEELCALSRPLEGDGGEASARFQEVQRAGEGKPIGVYLATPSTVQKLELISAAMPSNASSRLLALQGAGNRPRYLPRPILAREVRKALEPLDYVKNTPLSKVEANLLDALHEQTRQSIEKLSAFIDPHDREIQKEAVATADTFRTLYRALKISDSQRYTEVTNRRQEAYTAAITAVRETVGKLTEVAGDAAEYRKGEAP